MKQIEKVCGEKRKFTINFETAFYGYIMHYTISLCFLIEKKQNNAGYAGAAIPARKGAALEMETEGYRFHEGMKTEAQSARAESGEEEKGIRHVFHIILI